MTKISNKLALGAIIGDIVGKKYESENDNETNHKLFDEKTKITDCTVLTIATMDWLCHMKSINKKEMNSFIMKWAIKYPIGLESILNRWCLKKESATLDYQDADVLIQTTPISFIVKDLTDAIKASNLIVGVMSDNQTISKDAEIITTCIHMALNGSKKDEIAKYASYSYDKNFNCKEPKDADIDEKQIYETATQKAIYCFLLSDSFEDCLKRAINANDNRRVIAAISCALADAYYDVPKHYEAKLMKILPADMKEIINDFTFITNLF